MTHTCLKSEFKTVCTIEVIGGFQNTLVGDLMILTFYHSCMLQPMPPSRVGYMFWTFGLFSLDVQHPTRLVSHQSLPILDTQLRMKNVMSSSFLQVIPLSILLFFFPLLFPFQMGQSWKFKKRDRKSSYVICYIFRWTLSLSSPSSPLTLAYDVMVKRNKPTWGKNTSRKMAMAIQKTHKQKGINNKEKSYDL